MLDSLFLMRLLCLVGLLLAVGVSGIGPQSPSYKPAAASARAKNSVANSQKPQPNIILITVDTTRADRVGFLGSTRGLPPNLHSAAPVATAFTPAHPRS